MASWQNAGAATAPPIVDASKHRRVFFMTGPLTGVRVVGFSRSAEKMRRATGAHDNGTSLWWYTQRQPFAPSATLGTGRTMGAVSEAKGNRQGLLVGVGLLATGNATASNGGGEPRGEVSASRSWSPACA